MFKERLKTARENKKLTRKQVAEYLHLHETTYGKYELGLREPSFTMVESLSKLLEVPINYLLESSDSFDLPKLENEPNLSKEAQKVYDGLKSIGLDPDNMTDDEFEKLLTFIDRNKDLILERSISNGRKKNS